MRRVRVVQSETFRHWLASLADVRARARILTRIDRLSGGNPGDSKTVRRGVYEMRIDYGPGYRVYYLKHGLALVVLLCGGDKRSQSSDIERAIDIARQWDA